MLKNYFKVAIRYLLKNKGYTAISIFGLSVGVACCILIMLFVKSEFSYDQFHSKSNRIYRAWQHERYDGQDFVNVATPIPMGPAMQASVPGIEATCRINNFNAQVKKTTESFSENINMVDPDFFKIFDFALLAGSRANPFPAANAAILTEEMVKKYFPEHGGIEKEAAIGKTIEIQLGDNYVPFVISGIVKKAPVESSIQFDLLISTENAKLLFRPAMFHSWTNVFNETYVLLAPDATRTGVEKKFPAMVKEQLGSDYKEGAFSVFLQPIGEIHLDTNLPAGNLPISDPKYSYILATIGILILILACINFITLSIGRSATRALEVGVRKVLGADRKQLIRQFWGEAFLISLVSFSIGLLAAKFSLPPFNILINKSLGLRFDGLNIAFFFGLVLVIALLSGIYPALVLSGFRPVQVLKGKGTTGHKIGFFRQGLIVGQFVVAIGLIICTLIVSEQMKYLRNKDLGYKRDQIVIVSTNKRIAPGFELAKLYKTELQKHPEISDVSASIYSFAETPWVTIGYTDDKKTYRNLSFNVVDPQFLDALQIHLALGRNFQAGNIADEYGSIIVNESLVKEYGWKDPLGMKLPGPYDERVVGVAKDFNFESLHTRVKPLVLALKHDSILRHSQDINFSSPPQPRITVRLRPGNLSKNIAILRDAWAAVAPNQEFEFRFLNDTIDAQYRQEQRADILIRLASGLSIFIACMGLFGLATLSVSRRTKEIGIRKVLGASVGSILGLMSKSFLQLILLAAFISIPIAWWAGNQWLRSFEYRTELKWWIFVIAPLLALILALVTISLQAMKAARVNPVKSLKTE
ncbi:MAG: ABC transporter permease [Chitinophagales bacterium]